MSPETERLIRQSWETLQPMSDQLVTSFYTRLFEANPPLFVMFAGTNMHEQRQKFAVMLAEIVRVLDQPELLVNEVAATGRRHVQYGVSDRDYDDVGAALLFAVGEVLGDQFTPEVRAAWREAYDLLAAVMRRAAAGTVRE
jgi:hemoglobin-like flavoprotein